MPITVNSCSQECSCQLYIHRLGLHTGVSDKRGLVFASVDPHIFTLMSLCLAGPKPVGGLGPSLLFLKNEFLSGQEKWPESYENK